MVEFYSITGEIRFFSNLSLRSAILCKASFQGRMVRNEIATFQWTTRTTSIDWRFLQKDQIVNHFAKANFTTKVSW